MKRRTLLAAVYCCAIAGAAFAQMMSDVDTNGDGMADMEEMAAMYPDLTEDQLAAIDTNGDGMIDEEEMAAAVEAGLLPAAE